LRPKRPLQQFQMETLMRKFAIALAVLAAFGSTAAMADTMTTAKPAATPPAPPTVTGAVTAVDAKACTVTVSKVAYHFGAHCKITSLKVGETVTITYKASGKLDWITKIVVDKA
jgi:hypothetical protein